MGEIEITLLLQIMTPILGGYGGIGLFFLRREKDQQKRHDDQLANRDEIYGKAIEESSEQISSLKDALVSTSQALAQIKEQNDTSNKMQDLLIGFMKKGLERNDK